MKGGRTGDARAARDPMPPGPLCAPAWSAGSAFLPLGLERPVCGGGMACAEVAMSNGKRQPEEEAIEERLTALEAAADEIAADLARLDARLGHVLRHLKGGE